MITKKKITLARDNDRSAVIHCKPVSLIVSKPNSSHNILAVAIQRTGKTTPFALTQTFRLPESFHNAHLII
jgi:hypothetical protein